MRSVAREVRDDRLLSWLNLESVSIEERRIPLPSTHVFSRHSFLPPSPKIDRSHQPASQSVSHRQGSPLPSLLTLHALLLTTLLPFEQQSSTTIRDLMYSHSSPRIYSCTFSPPSPPPARSHTHSTNREYIPHPASSNWRRHADYQNSVRDHPRRDT